MNPRRSMVAAIVVLVVLLIGVRRAAPPKGMPAYFGSKSPESSLRVDLREPKPEPTAENGAFIVYPGEDPLVGLVGEGLNASSGSVDRDLRIVDEILHAWQTNFPRKGNPVGTNAEITRSLMGHNRLRLELIPPSHPAINEVGEWCDRWGTPLMFHQISGTHMELRSAGPDRQLYSADDEVWNSPPTP